MKRCEDCRHFKNDWGYRYPGFCKHPECLSSDESYVFGVRKYPTEAELIRKEGPCGPDARYFEPTFWVRIKMFFRGMGWDGNR